MTFDEQLKRAFDALSERLHDEVARQVAAASAALGDGTVSPPALAEGERLLASIQAIDSARSLHEVLDALVSAAWREASRVALLLVQAHGYRGWRFIGFDRSFDNAERVTIPHESAGVVAEAARTAGSISREGADGAPGFAALAAGEECLAVPLTMAGDVVAVLYADHGESLAWPYTVEVLARHASRCLEALTAMKAARALSERPNATPSPDTWSEDEHASAQRYARLLASEIKLYHEAQVVAGRRARDLATRLGGEIARAKALYEQRVPAHVRQEADHFHAELVRTLADGDESLLEVETQK